MALTRYTPRGIAYPQGTDQVALTGDLTVQAFTTESALAISEAETGLMFDGLKQDVQNTHAGTVQALDTLSQDVADTYATKVDLSEVITGDPVALTDAAIAGPLSDPGTSSGALLAGKAGIGDLAVSSADYNPTPAGLQQAINTAATFGVGVLVKAGFYAMDSPLSLPTGARLTLTDGAILDFSGAPLGAPFITAQGAVGSSVPVAGAITKGVTTIAVPDHGMTPGDWVKIMSTDVYDASSTNIRLGELIEVKSVTATEVNFYTSVQDTYTTGVKIAKVVPVRDVKIAGGTIRGSFEGARGEDGVIFRYGVRCGVDGVRFEGIDKRQVVIDDCVDTWVERSSFEWALPNSTGYGISFLNCTRDSGAVRNRFRYVRHSLSTNNDTTGGGVVRRVLFAHNTVEASAPALGGSMGGGNAIDTHTAAEDITIEGNTVLDASGAGINIECTSAKVINNTVKGAAIDGISVHNESDRTGRIDIRGNTVEDVAGRGIYVLMGFRGTSHTYRSIIVTGNQVARATGTAIQVGGPGTGSLDKNVVVEGNTILECASTYAAIALIRLVGVSCQGNSLYGCAAGIRTSSVSYGVIGPDVIRDELSAADSARTSLNLTSTTRSRIIPGAIRNGSGNGIGVGIAADCADLTVGKTSHIYAGTPVSNNGPASVVLD